MNPVIPALIAALLLGAGQAADAADTVPPTDTPAQAQPVAETTEVQPEPDATAPAETQPVTQTTEPETPVVRAAQEAIVPALLSIKITVLEEPEALSEQRSALDKLFDGYVRQRVPLEVIGLRVGADGLALIRDPNLPLRRYAAVEATDSAGRKYAMRVAAVLENHAAVLLEPVAAPAEPLPFVEFTAPDLKPGVPFLVAEPTYLEDTLAVNLQRVWGADIVVPGEERINHMLWWLSGNTAEALGHYVPMSAMVLLNDAARPIGLMLDSALWQTADGLDSWIGTSIMADRRISPDELSAISERLRKDAVGSVREVAVRFREDSTIAQRSNLENDTIHLYGILLDDAGRIFIPTDLNRNAVRQVEKFLVTNGAGAVEAEFEGLFKDFGGILIRAKGIEGAPARIVETAWYPRGRIFYTLSVRKRYGSRLDEVAYNRYLDIATGYKETRYPVPRKPMRTGELIADEQGRLIAFCAPYRREDKDEILAGQTGQEDGEGANVRMYFFSEIAAHLAQPASHFDPSARPMSRTEELGTAWLGVEYQQVTPSLARALRAEGPTRGGSRGLLVTHVYENSPATRHGIAVGDILLSLRVSGMPGEIDLTLPDQFARTEARIRQRVPARLWRPQINYLVLLLTRLGEGREVVLSLLHEGAEKAVVLKIEMAPPNFDTAERFADPSLDFTIRDMTYEVRSILKLSPDAPGVVVSDVTPGGKAELAQIQPYEIITHVNDIPVGSVKEFEELVRASQSRGRLEFIVARLGVSRIVEVDLLPR